MTNVASRYVPLEITAGVQPPNDATTFRAVCFTDSDKIRFSNGKPQTIGGWVRIALDDNRTILGKTRSIFPINLENKKAYVIGTNRRLYALVGTRLSDITPKSGAQVNIANSLATNYSIVTGSQNAFLTTELSENFITESGDTFITDLSGGLEVTAGSSRVRVYDTLAGRFRRGDNVTLNATQSVGGISTSAINREHVIYVVGEGFYDIYVTETASTSTLGGGTITRSSGLITVTRNAHNVGLGDSIEISGATSVGGIPAGDINQTFEARNITTNTFDVMATSAATSAVTGGGGSSVVYDAIIEEGSEDETSGYGFGIGYYGTEEFGVSWDTSVSAYFPRIWFLDRFGSNVVATPGNGGSIYRWDGNSTTSVSIVPNAPTQVNYLFVSNNILVTFGAGGVANKIKTSDQGNIEQWTASSQNQVFEDTLEGAGRLISHVQASGGNLIFTEEQTHLMRYTGIGGGNLIWSFELIEESIGIIAPMARVSINGVAFWMGRNNFYQWSGGRVEIVPSNIYQESTIKEYVFSDINLTQKSKIFCWYNNKFDEIWWHYPSSGSNEPDRIARYNVRERTWCPDTMDRTAAEYPSQINTYQILANKSSSLFHHEIGVNDDTLPMQWRLKSNMRYSGEYLAFLSEVISDSEQSQNAEVLITGRAYPQSPVPIETKSVVVSPTNEGILFDLQSRFWTYEWSGNTLNGAWKLGQWLEGIQQASRR